MPDKYSETTERYNAIKQHGYVIDVRDRQRPALIKGQLGTRFDSFDEALRTAEQLIQNKETA